MSWNRFGLNANIRPAQAYPGPRTRDLGGTARTTEFTTAILSHLKV